MLNGFARVSTKTLLFLVTVVCLGACFVWEFWEDRANAERLFDLFYPSLTRPCCVTETLNQFASWTQNSVRSSIGGALP
jgi:hypothetical protein